MGNSAAWLLGGHRPEVRVDVDPDKLRAYCLNMDDVTQAGYRRPVQEQGRRHGAHLQAGCSPAPESGGSEDRLAPDKHRRKEDP